MKRLELTAEELTLARLGLEIMIDNEKENQELKERGELQLVKNLIEKISEKETIAWNEKTEI